MHALNTATRLLHVLGIDPILMLGYQRDRTPSHTKAGPGRRHAGCKVQAARRADKTHLPCGTQRLRIGADQKARDARRSVVLRIVAAD
jgi:hypothetical protein